MAGVDMLGPSWPWREIVTHPGRLVKTLWRLWCPSRLTRRSERNQGVCVFRRERRM